jgi:hypothetical protein
LLRSTVAGQADQVHRVGLAWTNANVASFGVILDDIEAALAERSGGFFAVGGRAMRRGTHLLADRWVPRAALSASRQ